MYSMAPIRSRKMIFGKLFRRIASVVVVCAALLIGFYLSLIISSDGLLPVEREATEAAIAHLEERGFSEDVVLLKHLARFRRNDNWLNASVEKENAYAATNFPFGIVTLYPDFFEYPSDDVERAAILLHESKHLWGEDEKAAYDYVWKNRKKLGWTREKYSGSLVWQNVRKQTREYAPILFVCDFNPGDDCTEQ